MIYYILFFSILWWFLSVMLAAVFLKVPEKKQKKMIPYMLSYATGTLLAAAIVWLLPHAIEQMDSDKLMLTFLIGILFFFALEKMLIWRHCHDQECETHKATASMILVGDSIHNFIDGILIGTSFMISIPVGIWVTFSVIAHEIPQELGDFAILIHSGMSKKKAFLYNMLSNTTTVIGALGAYFFLEKIEYLHTYAVIIAASSFIYIALVDLAPELHKVKTLKTGLLQILLILLGVATILFFVAGSSH